MEGCIPDNWHNRAVVPVYKGKGDLRYCGCSRNVKPLEHAANTLEWVVEKRIWQIEVDNMQSCFMLHRGMRDSVHCETMPENVIATAWQEVVS